MTASQPDPHQAFKRLSEMSYGNQVRTIPHVKTASVLVVGQFDYGRSSALENDRLRAHIGRMAREKYESLLRCPMCGRTGLADMSDDKSSKIGDYDTRVEAVTQGFEIKGNDVICSVCQVSAL